MLRLLLQKIELVFMMYYTVKKPILEVINLEKEYFSSVGFGKKSVSKLSMTLALNYMKEKH
jgi:hypothetical protein